MERLTDSDEQNLRRQLSGAETAFLSRRWRGAPRENRRTHAWSRRWCRCRASCFGGASMYRPCVGNSDCPASTCARSFVAALVSEVGQKAHLNNDGNMTDTAVEIHPASSGAWANLRQAAGAVHRGRAGGFDRPNASERTNRNGDGDKNHPSGSRTRPAQRRSPSSTKRRSGRHRNAAGDRRTGPGFPCSGHGAPGVPTAV